jgi:hypothetical protein
MKTYTDFRTTSCMSNNEIILSSFSFVLFCVILFARVNTDILILWEGNKTKLRVLLHYFFLIGTRVVESLLIPTNNPVLL